MPNLLDINDRTPDPDVARMLAVKVTEAERTPYIYGINHDTRGPKYLPCPFDYDWVLKDHVGILTMNRAQALKWIEAALCAGYIVERCDSGKHPDGPSVCMKRARERAAYHQQPKGGPDDDIPF